MQLAHYGPGFYDGNEMGGGMGIIGLLFGLLILGTIVGTAIYLVRALGHQSRLNGSNRDPIDIARERYAKGEITKEELADIKAELTVKK